MKVLCTGSNGFVGRHFVKRLVDDGHLVEGVDNLSSGLEMHDWMFPPDTKKHGLFSFRRMDLREFVRDFTPHAYDLIIHCAAVVGGRLKIEGDPLAVATDMAIDADFFNWISKSENKKQKIVYFSSSAVYPIELQTRLLHVALSESLVDFRTTRIGLPDQTYGFAKLAGEYLAQQAVQKYGTDVVIYRPFSGYGEDQALDYPFPSIIRRVLARENPLVVWGSGEQARDFIHIDDVVEAVMQTKDVLKPGEVLNLGSGESTTFTHLAKRAAKQSNHVVAVNNDLTKPEGVFWRVADPYKMLKFYNPKISLSEGIDRALDRVKPTT